MKSQKKSWYPGKFNGTAETLPKIHPRCKVGKVISSNLPSTSIFWGSKRSDFPWDVTETLKPHRRNFTQGAFTKRGGTAAFPRGDFLKGRIFMGWPGVDHNLIIVYIYMLGDGHQPRYYMILGVYIPILFWDSLLKVGWPFSHMATFDPSTCRLMETVKLKWA